MNSHLTVPLTGGSSGIGLATVEKLLLLGASVINGDIQPPPPPPPLKQDGYVSSDNNDTSSPPYTFVKTNVAVWDELVALFKRARELHHGRLDHVFANAGIGPCADYLALQPDHDGDPREPAYDTLDVGLRGVMNTATLAIHYMRRQQQDEAGGWSGSIVLTGSVVGLQRLRAVDYGK